MIDQKAKLRISLLPIVVIILIILSAGYLLISNEINFSKMFEKNTLRRIEGFPTIVYTSNVVEKQREVIKNTEELAELLNKLDSTGLLEVRERIDFDREYLVAVSTEAKNRTGIDIKIRKIELDNDSDTLKVFIRETIKGESCTDIEDDNNLALDIVAISKTDNNIEFVREKREELCD